MPESYDLKLLFATRYTDSCFRAIRAVAQLADAFRVSVTIAHVGSTEPSANRELQSFFAEADHYESCRRVMLQGSPAKALAEFARQGGYDLILAPRSDKLGIPRPFHRSTRAAMFRHGSPPVWTGGDGLDQADFLRPYRTIAVGMDGANDDLKHLHLAASFAARVGATLKLLTVVPPISEGTLLTTAAAPEPLNPDVAIERIKKMLGGWSQIPSVDVAIGAAEKDLPRLAARCEADLLFVSESQSRGGFILPQVSRLVDDAPCGVIVVPTSLSPDFQWTFASQTQVERKTTQSLTDTLAEHQPARMLTPRRR